MASMWLARRTERQRKKLWEKGVNTFSGGIAGTLAGRLRSDTPFARHADTLAAFLASDCLFANTWWGGPEVKWCDVTPNTTQTTSWKCKWAESLLPPPLRHGWTSAVRVSDDSDSRGQMSGHPRNGAGGRPSGPQTEERMARETQTAAAKLS